MNQKNSKIAVFKSVQIKFEEKWYHKRKKTVIYNGKKKIREDTSIINRYTTNNKFLQYIIKREYMSSVLISQVDK